MTTLTSALMEGAMEGFSNGVSEGFVEVGAVRGYQAAQGNPIFESTFANAGARAGAAIASRVRPPSVADGKNLNMLPQGTVAYCRSFNATPEQVNLAVNMVMMNFSYPMERSGFKDGLYETGFVEREHRAAKWIDRYRVLIQAQSGGTTSVKVTRQVFIGRWATAADRGNPAVYNQGVSVGHNEAWLLTQIADRLHQ
jgi:hypothetical protein